MIGPMIVPVEDGPAVVACNTCRFSETSREDAQGKRGGARLVSFLHAVRASDPCYEGIAVQETPCLFACTDHCSVHLRAPDKINYVLGRFAPDENAARAIMDYALRYAASAEGSVAYRDWPDGVKGHFITRSPPIGYVIE